MSYPKGILTDTGYSTAKHNKLEHKATELEHSKPNLITKTVKEVLADFNVLIDR